MAFPIFDNNNKPQQYICSNTIPFIYMYTAYGIVEVGKNLG